MAPLFSGDGAQPPFRADFRNRENGLIYKINEKEWPAGSHMDFSHADAVDAAVLNQFLWQDRMGNTPMPEPQHHVFPATPEHRFSAKSKGKDVD
jgi:hypothetical protein